MTKINPFENLEYPIIRLPIEVITAENFTEFGQFVRSCDNRKPFDESDAQLDITRGTPRFYIMNLQYKPLEFNKISRHLNCSQCLGSSDGNSWYIAVCPADNSTNIPDFKLIKAFLVPPNSFVKLNPGTWHEGPYSLSSSSNYLNLEHIDTVEVDYETHYADQSFILDTGYEVVETDQIRSLRNKYQAL